MQKKIMQKKSFSRKMQEELRFYVYALIDPRFTPGKIFYIGKGVNNRLFDHVANATLTSATSDKLDVIREIQNAGKEVKHIILRHGLKEKEAFEVEAAMIDLLSAGYQFDGTLTNIQKGHKHQARGIISADELNVFRVSKPFAAKHKLLCININSTFESLDPQSIYKAVKESWRIDVKKAKAVDFILAEYCGHVVGVFKAKEWYQTKEGRWGFNGEHIEDDAIRRLYIGCVIGKNKGSQNPFRYFFPNNVQRKINPIIKIKNKH